MKIEQIDVFPLILPFKKEFKIARGSVGAPESGAPHVYVRLTADDGTLGWGEARPSHRWSYETLESVTSTIEGYLAPALIGRDALDLEGALAAMDRDIAPGRTTGQPIAKCAVDIALHDLAGRASGLNIQQLFGAVAHRKVDLVWTLQEATPADAERVTSEALAAGYRGVKVKLGHSPERDGDILRAARNAAGDAFVWADANQAYTLDFARRFARLCEELGVTVLEQPLPVNDLTGAAKLVAASDVSIALDESIWSPSDLIQAIRMDALDMVVIKLSKMGGLRRARQSIEIARAAGRGLLGSYLTESTVSFTAATLLFGGFGFEFPADMNGPGQFLGDGPAFDQLRLENGTVTLPEGPGLGLDIDEADVRRFMSPRG